MALLNWGPSNLGRNPGVLWGGRGPHAHPHAPYCSSSGIHVTWILDFSVFLQSASPPSSLLFRPRTFSRSFFKFTNSLLHLLHSTTEPMQ